MSAATRVSAGAAATIRSPISVWRLGHRPHSRRGRPQRARRAAPTRGERFELVVIGGSGLLALGLIDRTTRDVDLVALRERGVLVDPRPLPRPLLDARDRVAGDFGLAENWLNAAPASMLDFGLPEGFADRLEPREYSPALTVWLASRLDQIHFKLYALADHAPGSKHDLDLRALDPTREELLAAARWAITHDPSEGFRHELTAALAYLGVEDADLGA